VPLVATYRVVVAADALFVTPKKENANIAVQMKPTRVLFRIDVLPIIQFSIIKICFSLPVFYVPNEFMAQPLMVVIGYLYRSQILFRDSFWVRNTACGPFFKRNPSFFIYDAPEGSKRVYTILILLLQNSFREVNIYITAL
jgi:hypothetical protein